MKQDMRRFSSLEYEQSVPWLYYSCIKSGYLCKYCELFQKEVFQSVHTDQALLQTFPILGLVWFMVFNATFNNISVIYPGFLLALLGIAT
jgi:hypothetical protein